MTYARERQLERVQMLLADFRIAVAAAGVAPRDADAIVSMTLLHVTKAIAGADAARDKKATGGQVTGRKTP